LLWKEGDSLATIQVKCVEHKLTITNLAFLTSGSSGVDSVSFSFCPKWDNMEKTAVFFMDDGQKYFVLLSNDSCEIPAETLIEDGNLYFGVFGVKDEDVLTSELLKIRIVRGAYTSDSVPDAPTVDIYTQIDNLLDSIETDLEDVITATTALENYLSNV
jgi:hypothetical protein